MAKKTNFEINGNKYYRVTRTIGHKSDGTPIRKTFYGSGVNEANQKADEYIANIKDGLNLDFQTITINDLLYKWLFQVKLNELKPSSFQVYEGVYRNFIKDSTISSLKVYNVKSIELQTYYNELGKTKSFYQIKKLHKLLKSFFNYAYKEGYTKRNPCENLTIPNKDITKKDNISLFDESEIEVLKETIKGNPYENLILFALGTGLRQGEILALKWNNVDLDKGTVKVEETIKKVYVFDNEGNKELQEITSTPKTTNSIREVSLPQKILDMLKQLEHTSDYVFPNVDGTAISSKTIFGNWKRILESSKLPYRKFHSLRHTYASLLLLNGVDIKTVQDLMGHSDIAITQIYLHILPKSKCEAVNKIDYIF